MPVKILTSGQIRAVDTFTIRNEPISSLALMERAAEACLDVFFPLIDFTKPVHIFCGPGNNGGDGMVMARLIAKREPKTELHTWLVPFAKLTPECETNHKRTSCRELTQSTQIPVLHADMTIIDALLGAGASRSPEGILQEVIERINDSGAKIFSVDMPSGLPADVIPEWDTIIRAKLTATFQQPKLTFLLKETAHYTGNWEVVEIGLNKDEAARQDSRYYHLDDRGTQQLVHARERFSHKGTYGHALLIAGSTGKMGAAILSAKATLRSGAGLLTVHIPSAGRAILQTAVPEAMCEADEYDDHISFAGKLAEYSAIGIGPGIGMQEDTLKVLADILLHHTKVVIDADGLNLLASNPKLLEGLPEETILTPHPKEFERLAGTTSDGMERLDRLAAFAGKYQCTVILKDAITAIATKDGRIFFNTTGNPGMATAGSGDVLTGVVLGLMAQGYPAETAALIAVYFHGKAGDTAAAQRGQISVIASDIIENLRICPG